MNQSTIIPAPAVEPDEELWHYDDIAIQTEAEYRADEARRFAADPSPEDIAWWAEVSGDDEPDDAYYDALASDALGQDRLERGCLI